MTLQSSLKSRDMIASSLVLLQDKIYQKCMFLTMMEAGIVAYVCKLRIFPQISLVKELPIDSTRKRESIFYDMVRVVTLILYSDTYNGNYT